MTAKSDSQQQLIVAFEATVKPEERSKIIQVVGGREVKKIAPNETYLIEIPSSTQTEQAIATLQKQKGVRFAEANAMVKIQPK